MILGMFCYAAALLPLPAGQMCIGPGKDRGASLLWRNGAVVGRYIDDTYPGDPHALVQEFRRERVGRIFVGSFRRRRDFGPGTVNLVEYYPVLDRGDKVRSLPYSRVKHKRFGYILQAFSWGDNVWDGVTMGRCTLADLKEACAARYAIPSARQMADAFRLARRAQAPYVFFFYGRPTTFRLILRAERKARLNRKLGQA